MAVYSTNRKLGHSIADRMELLNKVSRRVTELRSTLSKIAMIEGFGRVALEHSLSAPVVATMRATPGFVETVSKFPDTSLYSIVPEHKTSTKQAMGLESLEEGQSDHVAKLREDASKLVESFEEVLNGLEGTANEFREQLQADRDSLEGSDISNEVIADLNTSGLSDGAYSSTFSVLEKHLEGVDAFDFSHLQSNPEKISEEIEGIKGLVAELGEALGLSVTNDGLVEADKSEEFEPTDGTFEQKELTKDSLIYYIDRADGICGELVTIANRKDELIDSLKEAVTEIPETLESDDVTYGAEEHIILLTCYTTYVTKLVRESIVVISRLLTTIDGIVEVDNDEAEQTVEDAPVAPNAA